MIIKASNYIYDADGYPRHRRLYEEAYGKLPNDWHVHHINEIKDDNDLDNLIGLPKDFHYWLHKCEREYRFWLYQDLMDKKLIAHLYAVYSTQGFGRGGLSKGLNRVLLEIGCLKLSVPNYEKD